MKARTLTMAALLSGCAASIGCRKPEVETIPTGHYQIVSSTASDEDGKIEHLTLKIDTWNGEVWKYKGIALDAGMGVTVTESGWQRIRNEYSGAIKSAVNQVDVHKAAQREAGLIP